MRILKKLILSGMRQNKKRTAVTILGIALAVGLITGTANLAASLQASVIANDIERNGSWHYIFGGMSSEKLKYFANNGKIAKLGLGAEIGYALLPESKNEEKPYLYLYAMNEAGMEIMNVRLLEGRLPQNDHEIVIGNHVRSNGGVDLSVGDVLVLQVGYRVDDWGDVLGQNERYIYDEESFVAVEEREYTIVGRMERPGNQMEDYMAPGYSVYTYLPDAPTEQMLDLFACYTKTGLWQAGKVNAGLLGLSEEDYKRYQDRDVSLGELLGEEGKKISLRENDFLISWELLRFSRGLEVVYGMAALAILIIMFTSVFCIRNSFRISLTERLKLYGMLASVGMTKRQKRKLILYEAFFMGLLGIPLGLAGGIGGTALLIQAVNGLLQRVFSLHLLFRVSLPAMLFSILLGVVTVRLSAGSAAKEAQKISPIMAIRGTTMETIGRRDVRMPKMIKSLFGIGGVVAYKNLRRASGKYRTTVVSLVVSISVFIGMSTLVDLLSDTAEDYLIDRQYQLMIMSEDADAAEKLETLSLPEGVTRMEVRRTLLGFSIPIEEVKFDTVFLTRYPQMEGEMTGRFEIHSLGREGFLSYIKELGLSYEEAEGRAILLADYENTVEQNGHPYKEAGMKYAYESGDILTGNLLGEQISIELALQTNIHPMTIRNLDPDASGILIVEDSWIEQYADHLMRDVRAYIQCENAEQIAAAIREDPRFMTLYITDYTESDRRARATALLIGIFLYGFITVITLIGVTNIFNTVTANMELRSREFAMLKAIGMTRKEFRHMIRLETVLYGGKTLVFGIPLGILLSYAFHRILASRMEMRYAPPWASIVMAAVAVMLLLLGIMRYSLSKINRKNIVETIQNENI